jgi:hypothetical protein
MAMAMAMGRRRWGDGDGATAMGALQLTLGVSAETLPPV